MRFTRRYRIMTAALFVSLGTAAFSFAQQAPGSSDGQAAGYVRITDRQQQPNGQPVQQAFHHNMTGIHHYMGGAPCPTGSCPANSGYGAIFDQSGSCPTGNCPQGNYASAGQYGNCPTGMCPTGNCPVGNCPYCRGCFHGRFCEHYCKHSPGYGYTPPAKYPLLRRGVQYDTYYPAQWYGAGGEFIQSSAPMVYQATDTTQLGFYYKQVPYWQPYPNPLPARPIPAQWNVSPAPVQAYGNTYGYYYYPGWHGHFGRMLHHHHGRYYQDGYGMTGSCPVDGSVAPQQSTPQSVNPGAAQPGTPSPTPVDANGPESPNTTSAPPNSVPQELPQTYLPPTPSVPADEGFGIPNRPESTESASNAPLRQI